MKKIPEMIAEGWHPTPDPTGRQVQFTDFTGAVMTGTVVAVEYEDDGEPTLYVEVICPEGLRREYGMTPAKVTWVDAGQLPWVASESPRGRWVLFKDEDGTERSGRVFGVDSCHSNEAVLGIQQFNGPLLFDLVDVPWQEVKWLP